MKVPVQHCYTSYFSGNLTILNYLYSGTLTRKSDGLAVWCSLLGHSCAFKAWCYETGKGGYTLVTLRRTVTPYVTVWTGLVTT
jgi:hypothetical protein